MLVAFLTSGEKGDFLGEHSDLVDYATLREEEAMRALNSLGVILMEFLSSSLF